MFHTISELLELGNSNKESGRQLFNGTDEKPAIVFPPAVTPQWEEQVNFIKRQLVVQYCGSLSLETINIFVSAYLFIFSRLGAFIFS